MLSQSGVVCRRSVSSDWRKSCYLKCAKAEREKSTRRVTSLLSEFVRQNKGAELIPGVGLSPSGTWAWLALLWVTACWSCFLSPL